MKKIISSLVVVSMMGFASISIASPKIDLSHHNNSVKGEVESSNYNKNANYNGNKNSNYNGNKNSNKNSNSNYNKASNYSNNKASANNYNSSYTNSNSKAKSNSQAKSNSGAYTGDNSVNVEGDEHDLPANSVPMSIGGVCVDSAAGQGTSFGLSISRASAVCEKLKMFEIYNKLGMKEEAMNSLKDAEALADIRGFFRGFLTVVTLGIL